MQPITTNWDTAARAMWRRHAGKIFFFFCIVIGDMLSGPMKLSFFALIPQVATCKNWHATTLPVQAPVLRTHPRAHDRNKTAVASTLVIDILSQLVPVFVEAPQRGRPLCILQHALVQFSCHVALFSFSLVKITTKTKHWYPSLSLACPARRFL